MQVVYLLMCYCAHNDVSFHYVTAGRSLVSSRFCLCRSRKLKSAQSICSLHTTVHCMTVRTSCYFVCFRLVTILRRSTVRILWVSDISKLQNCSRKSQRTLYLQLDLWDRWRMASVSISMMRLDVCMIRWFVICIVEIHSLEIPALRKNHCSQ